MPKGNTTVRIIYKMRMDANNTIYLLDWGGRRRKRRRDAATINIQRNSFLNLISQNQVMGSR